MGVGTWSKPKCLLGLPGGETILSRQLRQLAMCGIRAAVITTGYRAERLQRCVTQCLPRPTVEREEGRVTLDWNRPRSVGKVHTFYGNFGMHVRALAYILALGPDGLREATENAVLNANYLKALLVDDFELPYDGLSLHEFVLSGDRQ